MATQAMTAEQLLTTALERVESSSIREWASSERNRPIFVQLAQKAIDNKGSSADVVMFSAYVTATAIGL